MNKFDWFTVVWLAVRAAMDLIIIMGIMLRAKG